MADAQLEKEVCKIYKKIEKYHNEKNYPAMSESLNRLKTQPITLDILRNTKIGLKVNQLRQKVEDGDVKRQMRNLIKLWKGLNAVGPPANVGNVNKGPQKREREGKEKDTSSPPLTANNSNLNSTTSTTNATNASLNNSRPGGNSASTESSRTASQKHKEKELTTPNIINNASASQTLNSFKDGSGNFITPIVYCDDANRDKARDLIGKALRSKFPDILHSKCNSCAVQLEKGLNELYGGNMKKYKLQLMSKISNLKDDKNPDLRESFINGILNGLDLAKMTAQDMMSKELKDKNEKMKKENLLEHQVAVNQGTETDMFTCGKCRQKKCTYTQLQTRSSDEPMTTFVYCMHCGNRWKFC